MQFSGLSAKQKKEAKKQLQETLNKMFGVTRLVNLTDDGVTMTGGWFPAKYDHETHSLLIWGRCSRYSSTGITVSELKEIEDTLIDWFESLEKYV